MKIVQFPNGQYAIRKGGWFFGYRYVDLVSPEFAWRFQGPHFKDCLTPSAEHVKKVYLHVLEKVTDVTEKVLNGEIK